MGKNKPLTNRKKTLQLSGTRKLESGSPLSGRGIFAQKPPSGNAEASSNNVEDSLPTREVKGEKEEEQERLADFMKVIHTLGSRDDIEHSDPVPSEEETVAMATDNVQTTAQDQGEVVAPQTTFWHQVVDANSNHPYYWNPVTNEVAWTLPEGGVIAYEGTPGGDEAGEPLDYFAYYDEGIVVPERKGKGRGEVVAAETAKKAETCGNEASTSAVVVTTTNDSEEKAEGEAAVTVATKKKILPTTTDDEQEEGESQLMPTTCGPQSQIRETVAKKSPRGPMLPRGMTRSVVEEKPRKSRGSPMISGSAKQEQQALRFQVSSMADELSRKLHFLHVSTEGLSDMQILRVELKTRLTDWEEGGIDSKFLLAKLREASDNLVGYEVEAAPKGWKFHWDSTSCRYQFQHLSTGEISWEYPSSASPTEEEEEDEEEREQEDEEEEEEESGATTEDTTMESEFSTSLDEETAVALSATTSVCGPSVHPPPPPPPPPPLPPKPTPPPPIKVIIQSSLPMAATTSSASRTPSITSPTMTSSVSSPVATTQSVTAATTGKKPPATNSAALPQQVSRALVTPEMKQRAKVAAMAPGDKPKKDLATPTAAFLDGGEMTPAPLPRAWKYENDSLNRRVKREGSIERREEVAEKTISASDVRRKLSSKRSQSYRLGGDVDLSDLPPPPPPSSSSKEDPKKRDVVEVSMATGNQEQRDDIVKEAMQALSSQARDFDTQVVAMETSEAPPPPPSTTNTLEQQSTARSSMAEPNKTSPPPPPPPPPPSSSSSSSAPKANATVLRGGEESEEAKMRERLIERARRLRETAIEKVPLLPPAKTSAAIVVNSNPAAKKEDVEQSTGLLYSSVVMAEQRVELVPLPDNDPSNQLITKPDSGTSPAGGSSITSGLLPTGPGTSGSNLIKTDFSSTKIQVSYDRVEPETGESENVPVSMATMGMSEVEGAGLQKEVVGGVSMQPSLEVKKEDIVDGEVAVGGGGEEEKKEEVTVGGGEKEKEEDEEGEISSGSTTPGPVSDTQTVITPRCYMDREGGGADHADTKNRTRLYDSISPTSIRGEDDEKGTSRRYSRSRSPSHDRYGDRRRGSSSSKRRCGNTPESDYSDNEEKRYRRSKKKRRRRGEDYSDRSGSGYSDDERYSSSRRGRRYDDEEDEYDSDGYRRSSRGSSSRRRKRRSSRSRSRSKESHGSGGKHRHKDKSSSGSGKKRKKEKKEKKHKRDKRDENSDAPKPPKEVTVGRVGKVRSLRTLRDTPLDKTLVAVGDATSIDEKPKLDKEQQLEKKEGGKKVDSTTTTQQQHVQSYTARPGGTISSSSTAASSVSTATTTTQQAQVVSGAYPSYPQVSPSAMTTGTQGGYYSGMYTGYPYHQYMMGQHQAWGGGGGASGNTSSMTTPTSQWPSNIGTEYASSTSYASPHTSTGGTGMGKSQYQTPSTTSSSTIITPPSQYPTTNTSPLATTTTTTVDELESVEPTPVYGNLSESVYGNETARESSGAEIGSSIEQKEAGNLAEVAVEEGGGGVDELAHRVEPQNDSGGAADTPRGGRGGGEGEGEGGGGGGRCDEEFDVQKKNESESVSVEESRKNYDNQENQPPPLPPQPVDKPNNTAYHDSLLSLNNTSTTVTQTSSTCSHDNAPVTVATAIPMPAESEPGSDGRGTATMTEEEEERGEEQQVLVTAEDIEECEMEIDSNEGSPVVLETPPITAPAPVSSESVEQIKVPPDAAQVVEDDRHDDQESSPEPLPPGMESEESNVKLEETNGNGTETDEPVPPGMESVPTPSSITNPMIQASPPPPPPLPPAVPGVTTDQSDSSSTPVTPETVPHNTSTVTTATSTLNPTTTSASQSIPSSSSTGVTPAATATPTPSSTATTGAYDVAAAAAAYAHATKTGQPYQYPQQVVSAASQQQQQQQQGYGDYTAYSQYLQQMGQYGGGYVLGPDGQYYAQANPYSAYAAAAASYGSYYGAVYSGYGAYQTTSGQATTATATLSTSPATTNKEKGKKT